MQVHLKIAIQIKREIEGGDHDELKKKQQKVELNERRSEGSDMRMN